MNQIQTIENAVEQTNAVVPVADAIQAALVRDLGPIAERISEYEAAADMPVTTKAGADAGADIVHRIDEDLKAVKGHEVLSKIKAGLHRLHRQWTGVESEFITPMDKSKRQIKANVRKWEEAEEVKAKAEQRRLQAAADEAARKERERLEKLAESRKTPEVQEAYREQAAQVAAPVVRVEAQATSIRRVKRWKVKEINRNAFFAGLANNPGARGYVDILTARLERSKSANPTMEVPGVEFELVVT